MVITPMFSISTFISIIFRIFVNSVENTSQGFTVDGENNRQYRLFNAAGTQLSVRLFPPPPYSNPVTNFLESMSDLFEYALRNCNESDIVGVVISNEVNVQDKLIGLSFGRKDQLSEEVIWSMFEKVAKLNRFNAMERFVVVVHSVRMPVGFGGTALRTKGRQLANMAHLERNIIEVKAENNCLAHALIIALTRMNKYPNYQSYRKGYKKYVL